MGDVKELHRRWCIADGHADSLMWNRDLCERSSEGHVDFPRLREAGVKLQCFTLVTRGFPFIGGFPLFAAWRKWPREARGSEWTRALWQLERLDSFCARSGDTVRVATTGAGLEDNLAHGRLSAVLGVEGGTPSKDRCHGSRSCTGAECASWASRTCPTTTWAAPRSR